MCSRRRWSCVTRLPSGFAAWSWVETPGTSATRRTVFGAGTIERRLANLATRHLIRRVTVIHRSFAGVSQRVLASHSCKPALEARRQQSDQARLVLRREPRPGAHDDL